MTEEYRGALLVPDESFLRRLPIGVDLESRIRMDAIVIACDILSQSYQSLFQLGVNIGSDFSSLSNSARAAATGLCWSIVDQLHAVRQLVAPPTNQAVGPLTQRFLDASAPATQLRNKMDHLRNNLRNLAGMKGSRFPLFGAFAYVFSNADPATGGFLVTVTSGSLHGSEVIPAVNPSGRSYTTPVGLMQLHAFDQTFEFSPAFATLQDYIRLTASRQENRIRAAAKQESLKGQHSVDELMAHLGGTPAFVMKFDFLEAADVTD